MKQSRDDLMAHLGEQRDWLATSASRFDGGVESEAKRLALILRTLVHDTGNSSSLLGQLGLLDRLAFADSANEDVTDSTLVAISLAQMGLGPEGMTYLPALAPVEDRRPFAEWWTRPIMKTSTGSVFNRRALVLAMVNKDGGGHVQPHLPVAYAGLSRQNAMGWKDLDGGPTGLAASPVPVQVRQITHELQLTLAEQLPALLGRDS